MAKADIRHITRGAAAAIVLAALAGSLATCERRDEASFIGQTGRYVSAETPPPARYQGNATARVMFTDGRMVALSCAQAGMHLPDGATIRGCVTRRGQIVYRNPCGIPEPYAQGLCHELGHVNGWPADHPS